MRAHLIGGGLASMTAAVYLIKDAHVLPGNITIYEASDQFGGCLATFGSPESGFVLPAGRIMDKEYRCAFELFDQIPSISNPARSIKEEILEFNELHGYFDKFHIVDRDLNVVKTEHFGLSLQNRLELLKLMFTPRSLLDRKQIKDFFSPDFFKTEFWVLWTTLMNAIPESGAIEMQVFMRRFLHVLPDMSEMTRILRTRYNQKQAIAEPLEKWIRQLGVNFRPATTVTDVEFKQSREEITAVSLTLNQNGNIETTPIDPKDIVLVTNGSQIADLAVGSMTEPPILQLTGRSWALWERLAKGRPEFGNPSTFFGEDKIAEAQIQTFTVTTRDPAFIEHVSQLTASAPGRGGLVTFKDSNWLLTFALFHEPQLLMQPKDVHVWWGFLMYPHKAGNYVQKPALNCSGAQILEELLRHIKFDSQRESIMSSSICIPVLIPYANSVWLPRSRRDRPQIVPKGSTNFGFIGQFAEIENDANYTMEYSIRSAREAVATLLDLKVKPPRPYDGLRDPHAVYQAMQALV